MNKQQFWQMGTRVGIFLALLFTLCFFGYYVRGGGAAELKVLHENFLRLTVFGWRGMNTVSFILGVIQSFIWGYIAVGLWQLSGRLVKTNRNA